MPSLRLPCRLQVSWLVGPPHTRGPVLVEAADHAHQGRTLYRRVASYIIGCSKVALTTVASASKATVSAFLAEHIIGPVHYVIYVNVLVYMMWLNGLALAALLPCCSSRQCNELGCRTGSRNIRRLLVLRSPKSHLRLYHYILGNILMWWKATSFYLAASNHYRSRHAAVTAL